MGVGESKGLIGLKAFCQLQTDARMCVITMHVISDIVSSADLALQYPWLIIKMWPSLIPNFKECIS